MIFTSTIKLLTVSWCPRIWTLPFHQVTIGAGRDPCTSHCRSYVWFADRARFLPGKLTSRGRTVERCEKEEKILHILLKARSKDAKSLWQMPKFQDLAKRTRAGSVCLPNGVWISSRICGSGWHSSSGGNLPRGGGGDSSMCITPRLMKESCQLRRWVVCWRNMKWTGWFYFFCCCLSISSGM